MSESRKSGLGRYVSADPHRSEVEAAMWQAWSSADQASRDAGALLDREQFDEVTYLMLVEARDMIAKAMRREGFQERP